MHTIANDTRKHGRAAGAASSPRTDAVRPLRASARRLAGWWAADPTSARFAAAVEHDRGLLQRSR